MLKRVRRRSNYKNLERAVVATVALEEGFPIETIYFGDRIQPLLTHVLAGWGQEIDSSFVHLILPLMHPVGCIQPKDGKLRSPD